MKKLCFGITLALAAGAACAQFRTGNDLHNTLTSSHPDQKFHAYGYVTGVVDSLDWLRQCLPARVNVGQMTDVVAQMLQARPDQRHQSAALLVVVALVSAYQCELPSPSGKPSGSRL